MDNPMFSMLSRQKEYVVETSEGTFSGTYVGHSTTGQGFSFYYLENSTDEYRATLVIREKEEQYWVDCTKTDGSHETLAQMADFISIEALTTE